MKTRFLLPLLALLALGLVPVATPSPAQAATKFWAYQASAGATYVKLADETISSDLTAATMVSGGQTSKSDSNSTAAVNVGKVVSTGAAQTKTTATKTATSTTLKTWSRVASVNVLSGLVRIDAVTTTTTSTAMTSGAMSASGNTQFAGIHITGLHLPLNIPKNFAASIPGVADVRLNFFNHGANANGSATLGWALSLSLLQPRGGLPVGAMIILNPQNLYFQSVQPTPGARLGGMAYATQVAANAGSLAKIESGPTAFQGTPVFGSDGKTLTQHTAAVNVPALLRTGLVTSTSTSTKDAKGNGDVRNTSEVAGLSLLAGLIKADAIKVVAHGHKQDGKWTSTMSMTTVNLVIAGHKIPINISPNTTINVAGLGKVQLNRQVKNSTNRSNEIDAVRIVLSTAKAGLPVGAVIQLAVAATQIS